VVLGERPKPVSESTPPCVAGITCGHVWPPSVERHSCCSDAYTSCELCGSTPIVRS
jgi:hypothetical protein